VKKTAAEIKALNTCHAEQERLRKQRRAEQDANIARKRAGLLGTDETVKPLDIDSDNRAIGDTGPGDSEENDMPWSAEDDGRWGGEDEEWEDGEAVESSASTSDDEGEPTTGTIN
jgi:ribosome biogenesis protein SSF1/2